MELPESLKKYLARGADFDQGAEMRKLMDQRQNTVRKVIQLHEAGVPKEQMNQHLNATQLREKAEFEMLIRTRAGICQSLVIKWLKKKAKEQRDGLKGKKKVSPANRIAKLQREESLLKAVRRQDEGDHPSESVPKTLKLYELSRPGKRTKAFELRGTFFPVLELIASKVNGDPHCYYMIRFTCPGTSGSHAIGVYTSSGKFGGFGKHAYVFDPNFGELQVAPSEFSYFLPTLMKESYQADCRREGMDGGHTLTLDQFFFEWNDQLA